MSQISVRRAAIMAVALLASAIITKYALSSHRNMHDGLLPADSI